MTRSKAEYWYVAKAAGETAGIAGLAAHSTTEPQPEI